MSGAMLFSASLAPSTAAFSRGLEAFTDQVDDALNVGGKHKFWDFSKSLQHFVTPCP